MRLPTFHSKIFRCLVLLAFAGQTVFPFQVQAQTALNLPVIGTMVVPTETYAPSSLRGVMINKDNPLAFDFILDTGDSGLNVSSELRDEADKLIKYFLASLTVPEDQVWVNLSPYEKDRIVGDSLGRTEMGRDLLAQDYLLKQLTSSLMYPENELGKEFWSRVYSKAQELYGSTDIPLDTFNKIWIVPDEAQVFENNGTAFIVNRKLKVMLEEDYVALAKNQELTQFGLDSRNENAPSVPLFQKEGEGGSSVSEVIRTVLIPEIEKEINQGRHFAQLRQIYDAMILATWYKVRLKESLLGKIYVDQNKTDGVAQDDPATNEKIWEQYVQSFKTGVFNLIQEDYDPITQTIVPRKYFSGGVAFKSDKGPLATIMKLMTVATFSLFAFINQAQGAIDNSKFMIISAEMFSATEQTRQTVAAIASSSLPVNLSLDTIPDVDFILFKDSTGRENSVLLRAYQSGHVISEFRNIEMAFGYGEEQTNLSEETIHKFARWFEQDSSIRAGFAINTIEKAVMNKWLQNNTIDVLAIELSPEIFAQNRLKNPKRMLKKFESLFKKYGYKNYTALGGKLFEARYGYELYQWTTHPKLKRTKLFLMDSESLRRQSFQAERNRRRNMAELYDLMRDQDTVRVEKGFRMLDSLQSEIFTNGFMEKNQLNTRLQEIKKEFPYSSDTTELLLRKILADLNEFINLSDMRDIFMVGSALGVVKKNQSVWIQVGKKHQSGIKNILHNLSKLKIPSDSTYMKNRLYSHRRINRAMLNEKKIFSLLVLVFFTQLAQAVIQKKQINIPTNKVQPLIIDAPLDTIPVETILKTPLGAPIVVSYSINGKISEVKGLFAGEHQGNHPQGKIFYVWTTGADGFPKKTSIPGNALFTTFNTLDGGNNALRDVNGQTITAGQNVLIEWTGAFSNPTQSGGVVIGVDPETGLILVKTALNTGVSDGIAAFFHPDASNAPKPANKYAPDQKLTKITIQKGLEAYSPDFMQAANDYMNSLLKDNPGYKIVVAGLAPSSKAEFIIVLEGPGLYQDEDDYKIFVGTSPSDMQSVVLTGTGGDRTNGPSLLFSYKVSGKKGKPEDASFEITQTATPGDLPAIFGINEIIKNKKGEVEERPAHYIFSLTDKAMLAKELIAFTFSVFFSIAALAQVENPLPGAVDTTLQDTLLVPEILSGGLFFEDEEYEKIPLETFAPPGGFKFLDIVEFDYQGSFYRGVIMSIGDNGVMDIQVLGLDGHIVIYNPNDPEKSEVPEVFGVSFKERNLQRPYFTRANLLEESEFGSMFDLSEDRWSDLLKLRGMQLQWDSWQEIVETGEDIGEENERNMENLQAEIDKFVDQLNNDDDFRNQVASEIQQHLIESSFIPGNFTIELNSINGPSVTIDIVSPSGFRLTNVEIPSFDDYIQLGEAFIYEGATLNLILSDLDRIYRETFSKYPMASFAYNSLIGLDHINGNLVFAFEVPDREQEPSNWERFLFVGQPGQLRNINDFTIKEVEDGAIWTFENGELGFFKPYMRVSFLTLDGETGPIGYIGLTANNAMLLKAIAAAALFMVLFATAGQAAISKLNAPMPDIFSYISQDTIPVLIQKELDQILTTNPSFKSFVTGYIPETGEIVIVAKDTLVEDPLNHGTNLRLYFGLPGRLKIIQGPLEYVFLRDGSSSFRWGFSPERLKARLDDLGLGAFASQWDQIAAFIRSSQDVMNSPLGAFVMESKTREGLKKKFRMTDAQVEAIEEGASYVGNRIEFGGLGGSPSSYNNQTFQIMVDHAMMTPAAAWMWSLMFFVASAMGFTEEQKSEIRTQVAMQSGVSQDTLPLRELRPGDPIFPLDSIFKWQGIDRPFWIVPVFIPGQRVYESTLLFNPFYNPLPAISVPGPSSPQIPEVRPDSLGQDSIISEPVTAVMNDAYGGINLNAKLLDLQIKRDEKGIALPFEQQDLEKLKDVKGFLPIIINIQPIQNLPKLLGLDQIPTDENTPEIAAQLSLKAIRMESSTF